MSAEMNLNRIIYATDFSDCCRPALEYATAFAVAENAQLLIVHVDDETPGLVVGDVGYGYLPEIDRIAQEQLQQLDEVRPSHPQVAYEHHFLRGEPAEEIIAFAKKVQADLIVIGTHGASGLGRALLGSVAEEIVRKADCPVLTVRAASPRPVKPPVCQNERSQQGILHES